MKAMQLYNKFSQMTLEELIQCEREDLPDRYLFIIHQVMKFIHCYNWTTKQIEEN